MTTPTEMPTRCGALCDFEFSFRCNLPAGHAVETECTSCVWRVESMHDRGPGRAYRYHIQGKVLDADRPPQQFAWSVESLDNPKYDLSALAAAPQ